MIFSSAEIVSHRLPKWLYIRCCTFIALIRAGITRRLYHEPSAKGELPRGLTVGRRETQSLPSQRRKSFFHFSRWLGFLTRSSSFQQSTFDSSRFDSSINDVLSTKINTHRSVIVCLSKKKKKKKRKSRSINTRSNNFPGRECNDYYKTRFLINLNSFYR